MLYIGLPATEQLMPEQACAAWCQSCSISALLPLAIMHVWDVAVCHITLFNRRIQEGDKGKKGWEALFLESHSHKSYCYQSCCP